MKQLQPVLKDYLWGGEKLKKIYRRQSDGIVAESWEVSTHKDGTSAFNGGNLAEYIQANPTAISKKGGQLPVLIKYIDAKQNLSVQVHPNDAYAQTYENDNGKTEMWYIIQADKGAGIYCGFKRDTSKEEFLQKVADGTVEELLNFIPVKAGDCFLIKAGTVHAIGAGCLICEVQQNSNVTYRVYDYNRVGADGKKRDLHVHKAVDVINFNAFEDKTGTSPYQTIATNKLRTLTECEYFKCRELLLNGEYTERKDNSFIGVNVLQGKGVINGVPFTSGDSFFIDCNEPLTLNGKAKIILTTNNQKKYYAGIDLGGTFVKGGIVDEDGNLLVNDKIPTGKDRPFEEIAEDMANLVLTLCKRANVEIESVGVGSPGTVDSKNGVIVYSNNIAWENVPLGPAISKRLQKPVYVTNDANAAALGESFVGAGKAYKDVMFITLGTGVGGGIILNGTLFEGNKSAGAEIGHMVIRTNGEKCTCGRKGCFETYASATALIRQTKKAMLKNKDSLLWEICNGDINEVNGKTVFDGLEQADKTSKTVIKNYVSYLAEGICNLANIFRPEIVLLGGGISAGADDFLPALRRKVNRSLFGGTKYCPVKIDKATLGNDAGILGSAKFAIDMQK